MRVHLSLQRTTAAGEIETMTPTFNYSLNNFGTDFAPGMRPLHDAVIEGYRENGWQVTAVEVTENGTYTNFTSELAVEIMTQSAPSGSPGLRAG